MKKNEVKFDLVKYPTSECNGVLLYGERQLLTTYPNYQIALPHLLKLREEHTNENYRYSLEPR